MVTPSVCRRVGLVAITGILVILPSVHAPVRAEAVGPLETYRAITTKMMPDGRSLRIDILRWSTEAEREAVIARLTEPSESDRILTDLRTTGYVWPSGSGLGYSVKYAHHEDTADGQRITLVTGRRLGQFDREPWAALVQRPHKDEPFSVIELRVDDEGTGIGTIAPLATGYFIDGHGLTVSLEHDEQIPVLLEDVSREPRPYWAER